MKLVCSRRMKTPSFQITVSWLREDLQVWNEVWTKRRTRVTAILWKPTYLRVMRESCHLLRRPRNQTRHGMVLTTSCRDESHQTRKEQNCVWCCSFAQGHLFESSIGYRTLPAELSCGRSHAVQITRHCIHCRHRNYVLPLGMCWSRAAT